MRFLELDLKTKILHIIECRGPLLFYRVHVYINNVQTSAAPMMKSYLMVVVRHGSSAKTDIIFSLQLWPRESTSTFAVFRRTMKSWSETNTTLDTK